MFLLFVLVCGVGRAETLPNEPVARRVFDLEPGPAEKTLKLFSEQSGRSLILATSVTTGVQTKAVAGEFTPREALERMLAGTGLVGIEDAKSGAFTVRRERERSRVSQERILH